MLRVISKPVYITTNIVYFTFAQTFAVLKTTTNSFNKRMRGNRHVQHCHNIWCIAFSGSHGSLGYTNTDFESDR